MSTKVRDENSQLSAHICGTIINNDGKTNTGHLGLSQFTFQPHLYTHTHTHSGTYTHRQTCVYAYIHICAYSQGILCHDLNLSRRMRVTQNEGFHQLLCTPPLPHSNDKIA